MYFITIIVSCQIKTPNYNFLFVLLALQGPPQNKNHFYFDQVKTKDAYDKPAPKPTNTKLSPFFTRPFS